MAGIVDFAKNPSFQSSPITNIENIYQKGVNRKESQEEFLSHFPSLPRLKSLTYATYTSNGTPQEIPSAIDDGSLNTQYIIASYPDLSSLFTSPTHPQLQALEGELRTYTIIAGFLKVEWGFSDGFAPIEGAHLMSWDGWPKDTLIGYVGSFTTNPLLPRHFRLHIQTEFHKRLYEIAVNEGFANYIYTILSPKVVDFVLDSGLKAEHYPNAVKNDSNPLASQIMEKFPGYWKTNPQLYRFIPQTL